VTGYPGTILTVKWYVMEGGCVHYVIGKAISPI